MAEKSYHELLAEAVRLESFAASMRWASHSRPEVKEANRRTAERAEAKATYLRDKANALRASGKHSDKAEQIRNLAIRRYKAEQDWAGELYVSWPWYNRDGELQEPGGLGYTRLRVAVHERDAEIVVHRALETVAKEVLHDYIVSDDSELNWVTFGRLDAMRTHGVLREGYWAHVFNRKLPNARELEDLFRLHGEISVSEWDMENSKRYFLAQGLTENPRIYPNGWAAIIFHGSALHFEGDVWSYIHEKSGLRYPTSSPATDSHDEGFLIPAQSRPVVLAEYALHPTLKREWLRTAQAVGLEVTTLFPEKEKVRSKEADSWDPDYAPRRWRR